ncbi:MAG TPA: sodium:proton antiporter, partial [Psychrobacter sp.]|nr:sodium:proton antiporter [Psychrobacter sp.]
IDKEGHLHVITDSFDNEIPRDHKLVALVIEDEVQPKEVDVTEKQKQARALANLQFEATSKLPEKRKEKTITEGADSSALDKTESNPAEQPSPKADTQDKDSQQESDSSSEDKPSATVPATQLEVELATKLEQKLQKHSDSSRATSKASGNKSSKAASVKTLQSQDNGNSQAPRQADGSLDPQRLPDTQAKSSSDKSP